MTHLHLSAQQLGCSRHNRELFSAVTFNVTAGDVLLVEGHNGAGKSSLLRLIAGIATPAHGDIFWNQQSIQEQANAYAEQLHYIGHTNGIRLGLTAAENLALAASLAEQDSPAISAALSLLNLQDQQHIPTQFLSAGQKRRVALARLFIIPKKLWILDEPFTALDVATQHLLQTKIEEHTANGGICILTSHQPVTLQARVQHLRLSAC